MSERIFEIGGEALKEGSVVVVFDGNSQKELRVVKIGRERIFIESAYGFKPVPYSMKTRQTLQGSCGEYFRTKAEVAEDQRRSVAKSRLRDLGVETRLAGRGSDGLDPYPVETLEQVASLLEATLADKTARQQS